MSTNHCPNMRLLMVSERAGSRKFLDVMRVRCKQWGCPYCSPVNGMLWKQYLLTRLNSPEFRGRKWAFITLTANENDHRRDPIDTIRNLQRVWKKMYDRLRTYNDGAFDYVRVFEKHTKGAFGGFHLHVICDLGECYERRKNEFGVVLLREERVKKNGKKPRKRLRKERHPARWIKDTCRECKGGFIADFRPLKGGTRQAIGYTLKYTFKQIEITEFPKHVRRIQASRRVGSPKRKGTSKIRKWTAKSAIWRSDFDVYDKIYDLSIKRHVTIEDDFSNDEFWYPPELK